MRTLFILTLAFLSSVPTLAHNWSGARADGHAPIGVMGDHLHKTGEIMLSYRYMLMQMDGNVDGSSDLTTAEVLSEFMVAPLEMDMAMHMVGIMYAPSDQLTLMLMLPLIDLEMDHVTRMGANFTTETDGVGDIKLTALYGLTQTDNSRLHLNFGISFPTGNIDETGDTPAGNDVRLPYPMQLGSGTVDLIPGITYSVQHATWSWGSQAQDVLRLSENDEDYTLGDQWRITAWTAYQFNNQFSTSLRIAHVDWDDIDGTDPELNPMMVPTADPDRRGGNRTDVGIGINLFIPDGNLQGHRFAIEYLVPVRQDLDGPQLETDSTLISGWQYAF